MKSESVYKKFVFFSKIWISVAAKTFIGFFLAELSSKKRFGVHKESGMCAKYVCRWHQSLNATFTHMQ